MSFLVSTSNLGCGEAVGMHQLKILTNIYLSLKTKSSYLAAVAKLAAPAPQTAK